MPAEVGTDEERIMLGKWIQKGQGLIVGGSPLGGAYLDPNIERPKDTQEKSKEYVKFDHHAAEELPRSIRSLPTKRLNIPSCLRLKYQN